MEKEYLEDGRKPIKEIYDSYKKLTNFKKIKIYSQKFSKYLLPIYGFKSKNKGKAIYLISGIHGEEPAGVNAISKNIKFINNLSKKISVVIFPLCNPKGYFLNWRYPTRKTMSKDSKLNLSVATAEHLLLNKNKPRIKNPETPESNKICNSIIKISKEYPPLFMIDLHEDDCEKYSYIYSQGRLKEKDKIVKEISKILSKNFKIKLNGKTALGEKIKNGVVFETEDGSIDELFATDKIIINNKIIKKNFAESVIVVETPSKKIPIQKRIKADTEIIKSIPKLIKLTKSI